MLKFLMDNMNWGKRKKSLKKITLGICAMDKKAQSKPMREILSRIPEELFTIVFFGNDVILNQPVETWPVVEVLISFFSTGFPTQKALEYVKLRKPFMINDLEMEATLNDRRKVYSLLKEQGIDVPRHVFVSRDDPNAVNTVEEFDEHIVVNGVQINKPFVEKPVDADDHNIYIYYPSSAGGGSKRLFRKVEDRSSEFYPHINEVRREGSYIYEEFVITQGSDVKVYTVGPEYGHAEARKSPVVDGRVKRDSDGLEIRYPVILSHTEKEIARKVVLAFRQTVCGFDILRVQGKSYCCDVNGFSFVKNSRKYYEDASQILAEMMIKAVRPDLSTSPVARSALTRERLSTLGTKSRVPAGVEVGSGPTSPAYAMNANNNNANTHNTSSVTLGHVNHSSSTDDRGSVAGAAQQAGNGGEDRAPSPTMSMISDINDAQSTTSGMPYAHKRHEHDELRCVVAVIRHGDRTPKQKMKIKVVEQKYLDYFHSYAKSPKKELKVKSKSGLVKFLEVTREIIASSKDSKMDPELRRKLCQIRDVLERWEISGINRKLQMKPQKWDGGGGDHNDSNESLTETESTGSGLATELILILKWGGDLTPLGRQQAEQLGTEFRHKHYPDTDGGGVLRLHATYRHDLKIKASDEGRVMKTAAAFTKGLLELEGQLTPILASLVTVEDNRQMLDKGGNFEVEEDMDRCKAHMDALQVDEEMTEELVQKLAPGCSSAVRKALFSLGNPLKSLHRLHELLGQLVNQLESYVLPDDEQSSITSQAPSPSPNVHSRSNTLFESVTGSPNPYLHHNNSSGGIAAASGAPDSPNSMFNPAGMNTSTASIEIPIAAAATVQTSTAVAAVAALSGDSSDVEIAAAAAGTSSAPSAVTRERGASSAPAVLPQPASNTRPELYLGETFSLMFDRWEKLYKDFYSSKTKMFDLTKVPDIYDMIRYDILHNKNLPLTGLEELYKLAAAFENSVVPQEYGTDKQDKRYIGSKMCNALLNKIKYDLTVGQQSENHDMHYLLDHSHADDLRINSLTRCVRTRLYFTSESHLHTLLNIIRYSAPGRVPIVCKEGLDILDNISELSYLTQIVFRMFEDRNDPTRFHCEISLSPGATNDPFQEKNSGIAPYEVLTKSVNCQQVLECLEDAIELSNRHKRDSFTHELPVGDHKRSEGITVSMDELASTSDKWERTPVAKGKKAAGGGGSKEKDKDGDLRKKLAKKSKSMNALLPPLPHSSSSGSNGNSASNSPCVRVQLPGETETGVASAAAQAITDTSVQAAVGVSDLSLVDPQVTHCGFATSDGIADSDVPVVASTTESSS